MDVIFMGTPEFATPTLEALINSENHTVKAVFTKEPKPKNRGLKLIESPVHQIAKKHNIDIYHPKTLRNQEAEDIINNIKADIIVVVAYGFIIPKNILSAKKYGCLNIHPSDLPKYRGAAPLQRTILNQEDKTSVCIMQMDEGLDTGDILLKEDLSLDQEITFWQLHDLTSKMGAKLLLQTLSQIDKLTPEKQSNENLCYADKISKEEGEVNFHEEDAYQVSAKVRAFNPWPGAFFYDQKNQLVKILEGRVIQQEHDHVPATMVQDNKKLLIACRKYLFEITKMKLPGKPVISAIDYINANSSANLN